DPAFQEAVHDLRAELVAADERDLAARLQPAGRVGLEEATPGGALEDDLLERRGDRRVEYGAVAQRRREAFLDPAVVAGDQDRRLRQAAQRRLDGQLEHRQRTDFGSRWVGTRKAFVDEDALDHPEALELGPGDLPTWEGTEGERPGSRQRWTAERPRLGCDEQQEGLETIAEGAHLQRAQQLGEARWRAGLVRQRACDVTELVALRPGDRGGDRRAQVRDLWLGQRVERALALRLGADLQQDLIQRQPVPAG